MTKEDFEEWRAHPVTEQVFKALAILEWKNKQTWINMSWESGKVDPLKLAELRSRAQAAADLRELTFEELDEVLNDDKS